MIVIFFVIKTTISDAPNCGITYEHHSVNSRGVIYAPREH
jgi:hypothetical protein